MTWTYDVTTGEITAPWGEVVATESAPYRSPDDVQAVAESLFRAESLAEMNTDKIADYAQAWMGDVEVVR